MVSFDSLSNWGSPKFNRNFDGPQNGVRTNTTDIGEFTITVWACSITNFFMKSVNALGLKSQSRP